MKEAAIGAASPGPEKPAVLPEEQIRQYLLANAQALRAAGGSAIEETADTLTEMAQSTAAIDAEHVERRLTVLEERILASLQASTPEAELLQIRESADRDIAPYRSKMSGAQIAQLHRQYTNKRLLEKAKLPRLSLFYMG
jgi:hypothetical protein